MTAARAIAAREARLTRAAVLTLAVVLQSSSPLLLARAQAASVQLCLALTGEKGKPKPGAHALPCLHADRRHAPKVAGRRLLDLAYD